MFDHQPDTGTRPGIYLQSPDILVDPFPTYAAMREHHPICQVEPDGLWAVSRYNDVKFVLAHPELFSSSAINLLYEPICLNDNSKVTRLIISQDPPEHDVYHGMVNRAFISSVIESLIPLMRETAQSLLAQFDTSSPLDFVETFSYPYVGKITRHILGVGEKQSLAEIRQWVELEEHATPTDPDSEFVKAFEAAVLKQNRYFMEVIEERRQCPQNDLVTHLVNADVDNEKLTDNQLCGLMSLLVAAGFATTLDMLNHAVILLSHQQALRTRLAESFELIPPFIEELLRYSPSVLGTLRITTQEVELSGVTIPKDALVIPLMASANRDAFQFPNPDTFDLSRPNSKQHMTFGHGVHTCVGAALARLELKIALETLLSTYSNIDCPAEDQLPWKDTIFVRSVSALPVRFS